MRKRRPSKGSPGGTPQDSLRGAERPLPLYDRIFDRVKFLLALVVIWLILVWEMMADDPLVGFSDALRTQVRLGFWVFVLIGIELIRQTHYFVGSHSARYHRLSTALAGSYERRTRRRLSNWTRYRIERLIRWLILLTIAAVVVGKIIHTNPLTALARTPSLIWHGLPFVLQVMFILIIAVGQFAAIFWFMSRGGVDVYYPDDITTRFTDVWGQDHVLERVKESILFLENPDLVE